MIIGLVCSVLVFPALMYVLERAHRATSGARRPQYQLRVRKAAAVATR